MAQLSIRSDDKVMQSYVQKTVRHNSADVLARTRAVRLTNRRSVPSSSQTDILFSSKSDQTGLGFTPPPPKMGTGSSFPEVKWPVLLAGYLSTFSIKAKKTWSCPTSTSPYDSMARWAHYPIWAAKLSF
jgi:hypothetical protein